MNMDGPVLISYLLFFFKKKALLCASSVGHIDIIYLLLSKGANPTIYNHQVYLF